MIFWGEPGATRAREVAQDLIDAPTITLCQQNRPLSCPGCLHPARPITLFYMALVIADPGKGASATRQLRDPGVRDEDEDDFDEDDSW